MKKHYRVLKDTFLWEEGAILEFKDNLGSKGGYQPIEDIWSYEFVKDEYITAAIIENSPEWFERVYESKTDKILFITKEQFKESIKFIK